MRHVVIADDLTGANATGVLLKKEGLEAVTFMGGRRERLDTDSCIFSTNSRGMEKEDAYERVNSLANQLLSEPVRFFSKRIDSTMRGNIGAEIDGLLDALGPRSIAVCTPAYPDSGRTVKNGELLVNGTPLMNSQLARDPKSKISTSNVREIVCQQSKYPVFNLYEQEICCGGICLSGKMDDIIQKGYRILICDAAANEQIETIAQAVSINSHLMITADSGVLTAFAAKEILKPKTPVSENKVLAVVGSVNVAARLQLESLWTGSLGAGKVIVHTKELIHAQSAARETDRIILEALALKNSCNVVTVVSDGIYPENRINLTELVSQRINKAFGAIALKILEDSTEFKGLYTSGGDITMAVYDKLGISGIRILDEVLPLAVYGQLLGGKFPGFSVITKGGSQGDMRAIEKCVRYLFDKIQNN